MRTKSWKGPKLQGRSEVAGESNVTVNKITWAQVGRVTEPGRYMFKFGWLTITADDVAIWQKYPTAAFTLYSTSVATAETEAEAELIPGRDRHELYLSSPAPVKEASPDIAL